MTDENEETPFHEDSDVLNKNWLEYWNEQGASLVWQSWLEKYHNYINPNYQEVTEENKNSSLVAVELPASSAFEDQQSPAEYEEWEQLWEKHQTEQYYYYHNWFVNWWSEEQTTHCENSEQTDAVNNTSQHGETTNQGIVPEMKYLCINNSPVQMESKEQRDKTVTEKTRDFLTGLGFQTSVNLPGSSVKGCSVQIVKRKKKKKKLGKSMLLNASGTVVNHEKVKYINKEFINQTIRFDHLTFHY